MTMERQQFGSGRYQLLNLIARSSIREIYLAEDAQVSRQVAIKIFLPEPSAYSSVDATKPDSRFLLHEAEVLMKCNHPHILALLGYGEEVVNGNILAYLVMPFYPEGSFAIWLKQRRSLLLPQEVAQLVRQAAAALTCVHYNQVLHLNIKPSNFLIQRNKGMESLPHLLLMNFRIVKCNAASLAADQFPYGTPTSMAPEQWNGHPVPATDQYALAVMAYQLLTGRPPFQGTPEQLKYQHLNTQPQPPSTLNSRLTKDIDEVILHALSKKPKDRFTSVSVFAHAFDQAIQAPNPLRNTPVSSKQRGEDIHTEISISQADALTGTTYILPLSDGRYAAVPIPANAYSGQIITLEGQGKPSPVGGHAGALILTLVVEKTATDIPAASTTQSLEKFVPKTNESPKRNSTSLSRFKASLLLYCLLSVAIGFVVGGILNAVGKLPPLMAITASSIGTLIALLSGILGSLVAGSILQGIKGIWQNAHRPFAIGASILTIGLLTGLTFLIPFLTSDPYTHRGSPFLDDPLRDNSRGYRWIEYSPNNIPVCAFIDGKYHVREAPKNESHACEALATNFTNFVYEVQMTIVTGDCGGISFRLNTGQLTEYLFFICQNRFYGLIRFDGGSTSYNVSNNSLFLFQNPSSSAIHTGPKQSNKLAVVADGNILNLWVNDQLLASVPDSTYHQGHIAVAAYALSTPTEVVFSNAKVWAL